MAKTISKKICLLGDFAVGKTSLVRRFVYALFDDKYISTIGVKVSRKTVALPREDEVVELTLMLWDLAGSEEFAGIQSSYLHGTTGALLVCDLTRGNTLSSLKKYKERLDDISPNADVVITNPDHVAVALRYDRQRDMAPKVVAKGANLLCTRIKEIARTHGIPVIENPPLARFLYKNVKLDRDIPGEVYRVVAEILAYVYRLKGKGADGVHVG